MSRASNAYSKDGPAIEEGDPAAQQRIVRTSANETKPPETTAAPSIFAMGVAAKPVRKARTTIDLSAVKVVTNVPLPARSVGPGASSSYGLLWSRMIPGSMVELPTRQALSFISWAKKGLADSKSKIAIRKLREGVHGVWRLA